MKFQVPEYSIVWSYGDIIRPLGEKSEMLEGGGMKVMVLGSLMANLLDTAR